MIERLLLIILTVLLSITVCYSNEPKIFKIRIADSEKCMENIQKEETVNESCESSIRKESKECKGEKPEINEYQRTSRPTPLIIVLSIIALGLVGLSVILKKKNLI